MPGGHRGAPFCFQTFFHRWRARLTGLTEFNLSQSSWKETLECWATSKPLKNSSRLCLSVCSALIAKKPPCQSVLAALHIDRSVFLSQGSYSFQVMSPRTHNYHLSASDWLPCLSARLSYQQTGADVLKPGTTGVIISSVLTWRAAAVMFELVSCRSAVKTAMFSLTLLTDVHPLRRCVYAAVFV